jgi:hypothetical protein
VTDDPHKLEKEPHLFWVRCHKADLLLEQRREKRLTHLTIEEHMPPTLDSGSGTHGRVDIGSHVFAAKHHETVLKSILGSCKLGWMPIE